MSRKKSPKKGRYLVLGGLAAALLVFTVGTSASYLATSVISQMNGQFFDNPDLQDYQRAQEDAQRFKENLGNETRHLKDRTRECKDTLSNLKGSLKRGGKILPQSYKDRIQAVIAATNATCTQVEAGKKCITKAKTNEDIDDCRNDIIQDMSNSWGDIHDEQNAINNFVNVLEAGKEFDRFPKDWTRERKQMANEAKQNRIPKEKIDAALAPFDEKVKECLGYIQHYKDAVKSGDFDTASEATDSARQCNGEVWPLRDEMRQSLFACADISRAVGDVEKGIKGPQGILKSLAKKGKDTTALQGIIGAALQRVAQAKEDIAGGQCEQDTKDSFFSNMEDLKGQLEQEFENLGVSEGMK